MAEYEILRRARAPRGDVFRPGYPREMVVTESSFRAAEMAGGEAGDLIFVRHALSGVTTPYRFTAHTVLDIERVTL